MKKRGQGKRRRIFAAFLCLCVLFTTQPEIWNRLSVFAAEECDTKVVLSFAELSEEIKEQIVPVGTVYEQLELPEELNVFMKQTEISSTPNMAEEKSEEETVSGNDPETDSIEEETDVTEQEEYYAESEEITVYTPENSEKEAQELRETVAGVTWQSDPAYDGNIEDTYIFTAVLPESYTLAEDVSLPQITVTVKESESGTDFAIQTLLDRIAALPDVEEYLALEPDMEDEDAYAEWEEKLYAYAEEALAIWEEYEALAEEQHAQMPEEELAKLEAWMEIAETLTESSQVMVEDGASHTHCVCGGNINIGDHTNHTENIVYDKVLTSDNGQLLIDGVVQSDYTLATGKYYLADDNVELGSELLIAENSTVYICLNNHTISYNRVNGKHRVITVKNGATLNLCTCGNSGVITGGDDDKEEGGGGIYLSDGSIFNMYGGQVEGNITSSNSGGIKADGGSLCKLYNVRVNNNQAGAVGGGIGCNGNMEIYGGEINDNVTKGLYGGGMLARCSGGYITLNGVKICGNINNASNGYAAGIYITAGNDGIFSMTDVEISNNIVSNSTASIPAGGIDLANGTVSISGSIIISGNKFNEKESNFYNACNSRTPCKLVIAGDLDEQSVIGLTNKTVPTEDDPTPVEVASGSNHTITDADWSRFFSDKKEYKIVKDGNALFLALPGTCDLSGLDLTAEGAELEPNFQADITTYKATVGNEVEKVGITATLAGSTDGKTIKIENGTALPKTDMTSGVKKDVPLAVGPNTIVITVSSGSESKTYTLNITRDAPAGNPVTITAYKDGVEWTGVGAPSDSDYKLTSDDGNTFLPSLVAPDGTYKIYSGDTDTGVEVTVAGAEVTARVDYHTVTFYDGTNELTTPAQQIVLKNKTASEPAANTNPTKTGYTFSQWVTADGGSTEYDFKQAVNAKTSVYASWTAEEYTITYDDINGAELSTMPEKHTYGTETKIGNPTNKTGYTFAGWKVNDSTTPTMNLTLGAKEYTAAITLTATWTPEQYDIKYNGIDGATLSPKPETHTYGTETKIENPTNKTGYAFAGWKVNDSTEATTNLTLSATGYTAAITLTATWTPNTYQVTFNNHGADGGDTTTRKNVTYGSTYGDLPVPTKTGYTFKGWYTEAEGKGTEVNAGTIVTTASAHTLHAYWKDETPPDKPVLQDGVTLPKPEVWTNDQTTIPLKLYDGVGVNKLLVSVDGTPYTEVSGFSSGTGSMTHDYTPVQEGEHKYQFKAVDAAGNFAESDIFPVRLDQTKPVIGKLAYDNAVYTNLWHWIIGKKSIVIHVPVTDTGSGVEKISYTMTPRDAAGNLDSNSAEKKTAAVTNGEAKITFDKDFRGTITINCTDKAGNAADSMTIGADAGGVIVEDNAPDITILADRNISDTQQTQPGGVAVSEGYYNSAPALFVTVKDDTGNAITAGIDTVTYQVEGAAEKSVTVDTSVLQEEVTFTIPASEIPTGITEIKVTATDNAGNTATKPITVKVKGPEKQPDAKIDYRQEELKNLVPGAKYTIDGTAYTADGEGRIPIIEGWFGKSVSIIKKGNGNETTDSTAQSLPVPARPAAPDTPELSTRDDKSITLKTITGAQYRLADGTDNWQDSTVFTGLAQKTIYRFRAYYPATDTSFASAESSPAQIATMPTAPTEDKLRIGYAAETLTLTDGIEAFADAACTIPVTAGSVTAYMGQTVYIRYPANGIIPASLTTAVSIPARPAKPVPGKTDASYPTATDGAITGLTPGTTYEYRVKEADGDFGAWKTATPSGTKIENLPAGDYEVRIKAVETGNASFQSETAAVTIGADPATKYEKPNICIDYPAETLTGFVPDAEYTIGSDTITAGADGTLPIKKEWFGTALSITRNGNEKDKLDSDPQSLPIPARPAKPTPTGVDVSTAGGTGKLTGLTAGTAYEVSTDGGKTWASHTADGSGQITGLSPGTYVVRVEAGTDNFVSEPSDSVKIGAYQIKVTFMVDGAKYREVSVDYGAALTDIPPVPAKDNAIGAWCMDEQGTTPAVFTNITVDMTVYAVYTTAYTVTLQTSTGYTLSAQGDSESPVKEGGSFTFRFALADGYQRNADFAVKVNGVKVELTAQEPYTYTITDIRENKTVTVEGVTKKPGGKPSNPGGGDKGDEPEPTPSPSESSDDTPSTPPVKPPAKPTPPAPGTTSQQAEKEPEGRKPGTTPKQEESGEPEPESTGTKEPEKDSADAGQTEKEPQAEKKEIKIGNGTVIVTVVCEEEKCTATVADTEKVVKAVLTPDQQALVNGGETIEIRIDVTDISEKIPAQDKEVIEGGIEAYREEVPGLVLGMYVDISMFIRIGAGDWNAITETDEPIEVVINIPEKLQRDGREYYIIRAHNGEYTFMDDLDDTPDTITVSTDLFSSYAIAYVETEGAGADSGAKCGLCHICPTFLGICYFIWLAIIIALVLVIYLIIRRKRKEEENEEQ